MVAAASAGLVTALSKWLATWCLFTALGSGVIFLWARIETPVPPSRATQAWAIASLRAAERCERMAAPPDVSGRDGAARRVFVRGWRRGRVERRYDFGASLSEAIGRIATDLRRSCSHRPHNSEGLNWRVSVAGGEAPLLFLLPFLRELSLLPLREGVVARYKGGVLYRLPDELLAAGVYDGGVSTPIADLRFGVDVLGLRRRVAAALGASPTRAADVDLRRLSAFSWGEVEYPREQRLTAAGLRLAARQSVEFLLRHQQADGRFAYVYEPSRGRVGDEAYHLPRHAGTAYFLAQAARLLRMSEARSGAVRAIRWAVDHATAACGPTPRLCVTLEQEADFGASALLALAIAELLQDRATAALLQDRATAALGAASANGSPPEQVVSQLRSTLGGLTAFLRSQQRADGEFMHGYNRQLGRPIDVQRLYYSGETSLALLRAHRALGDRANLQAAQRALRYLGRRSWNFFASRYYFGEEHWTCMAAAEAVELGHAEGDALALCQRWAEYNRVMQYREGETPWPSAGAYGVGPLLVPLLTPVSTRTEAAISLFTARRRMGQSDAAVRAQIEAGLKFLLRWRFAPGPAHLFAEPQAALGGVPASATLLWVRNDVVQHAASAMLRWAAFLEESPRVRP